MGVDVIALIMNPFVLMFVVIVSGALFGGIRFGGFSFGVSGTLFTGLLAGWLVCGIAGAVPDSSPSYETVRKAADAGFVSNDFFELFLIIFIASVGLLASKDIPAVMRRYGPRFIVMGIATTFVGFLMTYGLTLALASNLENVSPYEVSGVYTGALTSSPGLAAALETAKKESAKVYDEYIEADYLHRREILETISPGDELDPGDFPRLSQEQVAAYSERAAAEVGIGHAVAYPFGVLIVILSMNFFPKIFRIDIEEEWLRYERELGSERGGRGARQAQGGSFDTAAFFLVCILGIFVGGVSFPIGPLGNFALGTTGGVLIVSLVLGCIARIGPLSFCMDEHILVALRRISISFFLGIVGLRYGGEVVASVSESGAVLVAAAAIICVVAATFSFVLGRYVFGMNWIILAGAICGGMTSTPGLGAATDTLGSGKPAGGYGAAYPFALLTKVILVIVLHKLPM
jgi:putative transport protein